MRDDTQRLLDTLEATERIERYSDVDKATYESSELIQTWMVHNIQIMGEAAAGLSERFGQEHSEVPWRAISSMRNVLIHAYFRVYLDEVWNVVRNDLPVLKGQIKEILDDTSPGPSACD